MSDKIGGKKIGGVRSTQETGNVKGTEAVGEVGKVNPTGGVGGVGGVGRVGKRGPTRVMTAEERQKFLRMVDEEADKLVESGAIPSSKRDVVRNAVKMAVDAGFVSDEEDDAK